MAERKRVVTILGTRPDAIKLAPVIRALDSSDRFESRVLATAQHREMLDQVLGLFDIEPDHDLDLMEPNQRVTEFAGRALLQLGGALREEEPDLLIVQGDTTTALVGALAGFYHGCAVAHVEAGLRSFTRRDPFPEEGNRRLISQLADLHFAPTETNRENLLAEGAPAWSITVTGNSVIDSLLHVAERAGKDRLIEVVPGLDLADKRLVLVTLHRRESFGAPLRAACDALKQVVKAHPDVEILYPVHPNPNVREAVIEGLGAEKQIHLVEPLGYVDFIAAMKAAYLIVTDSGGIQEEAPALGKPVLVVRETTERPEAVEAGGARLIGRDPEAIVRAAHELLTDPDAYRRMSDRRSPYGDGKASERILTAISSFFDAR